MPPAKYSPWQAFPDFNPNNRDGAVLDDFRNRAISDTFEPGSTVKPLVIMTALQQGIVQPDSVIDTHPFIVDGHRIRDVDLPGAIADRDLAEIERYRRVTPSLAMPVQKLLNTYKSFGFGDPTGLGLTGESRGLMPQRRYWSDLDRATFAFGYGLMVTPLQLAHVCYPRIGSFGIYRPLSITRIDPPVIGTRVMPEALVHQVEHMMESVALPGGGGTKAAVRDYRVAVKTGTAKKIGDDGKYVDKYVAYTAGVAPASDPKFALVVVINNPQNGAYYGGAVSAPVFSQIMGDVLRLENVKPDGMPADSEHLLVMHGSNVSSPSL